MTAQTILPANTLSSGFDVANGCLFFNNTKMNRTNASTSTNRQKGAFSTWIKKHTIAGTPGGLITGYVDSNNYSVIYFDSDHRLNYLETQSGSTAVYIRTTQIYKDPTAWMHVAVLIDSTQGTAANRYQFYVNGSRVTNLSATTYGDQNLTLKIFTASTVLNLGEDTTGAPHYLNGTLCETLLVDGSTVAIGDLGEFDEDSPTIWKPKDISTISVGTNGFRLDYQDSSNLGNDATGGTDLSESNIVATDQTTDTCTNNFCVLNPLDNSTSVAFTLTEGNLVLGDIGSGDNDHGLRGTFGVNAGKWYYEVKRLETSGTTGVAGSEVDLIFDLENESAGPHHLIGSNGTGSSLVYWNDGNFTNNASLQGFAANAIIGVALDMDNGKLFYSINGTFKGFDNNASDPAAGTNANFTDIPTDGTLMMPYVGKRGTANPSDQFNFGNPSFSISSGNADGAGHGNFEYAPPSGFFSLCTKNLANHG